MEKEVPFSYNNYLDVSDVSNYSDDSIKENKKKKKHKKIRKSSSSNRWDKSKNRKINRSRSKSYSRSESKDGKSNSKYYKKKKNRYSTKHKHKRKRDSSESSSVVSSESSDHSDSDKSIKDYISKDYKEKNKVVPVKRNVPKWSSKEDDIIIANKEFDNSNKGKSYEGKLKNESIEVKEKQKIESSEELAKETNTVNGSCITLKFTEPQDSAKPNEDWRLYTYKDDNKIDVLYINNKPLYLIGKEHRIVDILVNHMSCSRQHAVIQFRKVSKGGKFDFSIIPYILDLESTNGTFINKNKIEPSRYHELKVHDVLNFGQSKRDYVLIKAEKEANE